MVADEGLPEEGIREHHLGVDMDFEDDDGEPGLDPDVAAAYDELRRMGRASRHDYLLDAEDDLDG